MTMHLTDLARAINRVRETDDPLAAAHVLIPDVLATLTPQVDRETAANLWTKLARHGSGRYVPAFYADPDQARSTCLAVLGYPAGPNTYLAGT